MWLTVDEIRAALRNVRKALGELFWMLVKGGFVRYGCWWWLLVEGLGVGDGEKGKDLVEGEGRVGISVEWGFLSGSTTDKGVRAAL